MSNSYRRLYLKVNLSTSTISALLHNYLLVITVSIILSSLNLSFAQYTERMEELTRKMEEINKQIEGCGSDLGCIQSKMKQIEQLTKEIQSLQKDLQKNPGKIIDDAIDNLPKENEFPPPFDKISKPWLKHTTAASTFMKFNCDVITDTREKTLDKIDEIYKKGKGLTGPAWPLPVFHCEETNVKLRERGVLNEPGQYYLEYEIEFTDKAVWTADYILLIGGKHIGYEDKHSYKLGVSSPPKRNTNVLNFAGWIMDNSKDPPVQLPLNQFKILEQDIIDIGVQVPSYQGYTLIYPENIVEDKNDKYKLGKVTSYRMVLPYQIIRFYPASKPGLFVENTELIGNISVTIDATYSAEEIQSFFQNGQFTKNYNADGITQVLEIGIPSLGCDDQISSTKGAIILSGDCIDHGGYVIASDTSTIVNGKPVARIGDKVLCYKHGETEIILVGINKVTSGKKQIARIGDKTKCGAKLLGGSQDTFAGNK
jgi:uncharacterized Zn-binding protein involved in type VI secretion